MTDARADAIVDAVASGLSLNEAATTAGVSPRTLRSWRARAWSTAEQDAAYVAFERRLRLALGRASAAAPKLTAGIETWEDVAARLERDFDWGVTAFDDDGDWLR